MMNEDATRPNGKTGPLSSEELRTLKAYRSAANHLSVGQIYLLDNPLPRQALTPERIKPRLLRHWVTRR